MISGQTIICFAGEDWWYHHPHSKNHIMKRLAKTNSAIFVNSISTGLPAKGDVDWGMRIARKLRSYAKWMRTVDNGLVVMSPLAFPKYDTKSWRGLNARLLSWQIKLVMRLKRMPRVPIVWVAIPTAVDAAERLKPRALIYQVSDKYDAFDHTREYVREMDEQLMTSADIVLFSGRKLYEEQKDRSPHAHFLAQAADVGHFGRAMDDSLPIPPDIASVPHPILGYFGAMEWVIDHDLVTWIARQHPDWSWVFIGQHSNESDPLETLPNVHVLGPRPYEEMPAYAKAFDVCVLPWAVDEEFVRYGSAIKVREYMATGKPVVIMPLPEYESYKDIITIARTREDFVQGVQRALASDSRAMQAARLAAVKNDTWDARAEEVSSLIETVLARGAGS